MDDRTKRVMEQALASAEQRSKPLWVPTDKWLPNDCEGVLACDLGTYYVAYWNGSEWIDCFSEEPIDCHITHWMHLPDMPEEN